VSERWGASDLGINAGGKWSVAKPLWPNWKAARQALKAQRQVIFITGGRESEKTTLVDEFHQISLPPVQNLRVVRGSVWRVSAAKKPTTPCWKHWANGFVMRAGQRAPTLAKQAPTWLIQFPSLVRAEQREALQKEIVGATRERMVRKSASLGIIDGARSTRPYPGRSPLGRFIHS